VLLALANRVNSDTGLCCPSVTTIMAETELGRATVFRALESLEDMGFIKRVERTRVNGSRTSNDYRFPSVTVIRGGSQSETGGGLTVIPPEPELRTRKEPSAATPRERNEIWDAIVYVFPEYRGELTPSEQKKIGKVCAELKAAGATRDQIVARASSWPAHYDDATLTPHALVNHWSTLSRKPRRQR
jgi:DNA-binding transcriptional MocR family regulator